MADKKELRKLYSYLDECLTCLHMEEEFYNFTLMFDNMEDLRKSLEKDYRDSVDVYNKGVDRYNALLDKVNRTKKK